VTVLYDDSTMPDDDRREKLFGGDLFIYSPTAHSIELVAFAREMAEKALTPHHPPTPSTTWRSRRTSPSWPI
jgi:hypothetical protein